MVGDWAARMVAADQPTKLAAMEGLAQTTTEGAPESLFGYYSGGKLHGALHIPDGLSLLARLNPHATVQGLDAVPAADRPSLVTVVHLSFDLMVAIGFGLLALGAWLAWSWWRAPRTARAAAGSCAPSRSPGSRPWPRWNSAGSPPRSAASPGSSTGVMRVANAVNPEPGIQYGFFAVHRRSTPC